MKKDPLKARAPENDMAAMQGRLQELLEQGRRLRQQIETISGDVDFPLTRDSDGDPRLRKDADRPDPISGRQRRRGSRTR